MPRDAVASTARRVRAAPSPARRSRSLFRPHPSRKNPLVATATVAGLRRRCEDATYLDGRADEGGHGNGESGHVVWSKNDECGVCERAPGVSARRLTRGFLTNFLQPKPLTPKNEAGSLYQCKIQWKIDRRSRFTGRSYRIQFVTGSVHRAPPALSTLHTAPSSTMSAVTNSAVFARKSLAGKAVANKRVATKARAAFNVSANAKVDACDKNSVIVSPSILSANFATLGAEVRV